MEQSFYAGDAERRVALVIGNGQYRTLGRLENPCRDAESVAAALRQVGFDEVILKTDLSHDELFKTLKNFVHHSLLADWAIVYFAGHAIEVGGHNYLIPTDAQLKSYQDIELEAIPLQRVMNVVERAKSLRLVILDACRNNPFTRSMGDANATRSIGGRGLGIVEPDPGTLVVYAAKHGSIALDGDNLVNSPFTRALVKYLVQPGIEVSKLFRYVRDDVVKETQYAQVPYEYGSLPARDFYFLRPQSRSQAIHEPSMLVAVAGPNVDTLNVKRIIDPDDDDLFAIWKLQEREFTDETADSYVDMQRWMAEIRDNYEKIGEDKLDDIMLALKLQDEVVGYLYAQHYIHRELIFISYLGYDVGIREARRDGAARLLRKLFEICEQKVPRWKAVVAEVEQIKNGRKNHSYDLFVTFKRYEKMLRDVVGARGVLFMLDFDYLQPAIKPTDMGLGPSESPSLIQKLLFLARDVNDIAKTPDGKYMLAGTEAMELFKAVISCVYGDAYRENKDYQDYLTSTQESYRSKLANGIRLIEK